MGRKYRQISWVCPHCGSYTKFEVGDPPLILCQHCDWEICRYVAELTFPEVCSTLLGSGKGKPKESG